MIIGLDDPCCNSHYLALATVIPCCWQLALVLLE